MKYLYLFICYHCECFFYVCMNAGFVCLYVCVCMYGCVLWFLVVFMCCSVYDSERWLPPTWMRRAVGPTPSSPSYSRSADETNLPVWTPRRFVRSRVCVCVSVWSWFYWRVGTSNLQRYHNLWATQINRKRTSVLQTHVFHCVRVCMCMFVSIRVSHRMGLFTYYMSACDLLACYCLLVLNFTNAINMS